MSPWIETLVTIFIAVIASSGFWTFMVKKMDKKDVTREMLVGLAHDRIMYLGLCYIERGWISRDEYENLYEYLYKPYQKLNGNGSAKRIMEEVNKLPIKQYITNKEMKNNVTDQQNL